MVEKHKSQSTQTLLNYLIISLSFLVEMVSAVVDTDYSRWAVVAQCTKNAAGEATFQSSRILSRSRSLRSPDLDRARAAIRDADVEGPYKYTIDQENCH